MRLYSTQWVVVDYNVLNKINSTGDRSIDKLLIIIEEIPSIILAADLSKLLLQVSIMNKFSTVISGLSIYLTLKKLKINLE
jgi:hypothetical protein